MDLISPPPGEAPSLSINSNLCKLTPLAQGGYRLHLTGKFPPGWMANLTGGLSAQGVSVLRGQAHKVSPLVWEGQFEIVPAGGGALPSEQDCLAMAGRPAIQGAEAQLALDRFLVGSRDEALHVEVQGRDTVGFLKTLLKLFAFYSLHPAKVSIDTPNGRVHDRFWLKGLAGLEPTADAAAALRQNLQAYLVSA